MEATASSRRGRDGNDTIGESAAEAQELADQSAAYFDSLKRSALDEDESKKKGNREMAARVDALYSEAQACLEDTPPNPTEALQLMQKGVYIAPQDGRLYALRAECYVFACDFRSAVLNLRKSMACTEIMTGTPSASAQRRLSQVLDVQGLSLLRSTMPGSRDQSEEAFTMAMEADRMAKSPPFHLALARFVGVSSSNLPWLVVHGSIIDILLVRTGGLQRGAGVARRRHRVSPQQRRTALPPASESPLGDQKLRPCRARYPFFNIMANFPLFFGSGFFSGVLPVK